MQHGPQEQTFADYLAVVRRYKWLILVAALVVPVAAYVCVVTADEGVSRGLRRAAQPTGPRIDPHRYSDAEHRHGPVPVRANPGAASPAFPTVTRAAIARSGVSGIDEPEFAANSDVNTNPDTDILTFGVNNRDADVAARLATAYAESFVAYKLKTETASLQAARRELQGRLAELRDAGATDTETYRQLAQQEQSIRTLELLLRSGIGRPARGGRRADRPDAPDATRYSASSSASCSDSAGHSLLNALRPANPPRRTRSSDELADPAPREAADAARTAGCTTILDRPAGRVRQRLSASSERASTSRTRVCSAKIVMVTSAGPREGKSTTIAEPRDRTRANRPPCRARRPRPSPADAQLGSSTSPTARASPTSRRANTDLADALQPVGVTPLRARRRVDSRPASRRRARLEVITTGRTRVEPGGFVESSGLTEALQTLRAHAEIVLVDAPPILATGDSMALTGKVDAVLAHHAARNVDPAHAPGARSRSAVEAPLQCSDSSLRAPRSTRATRVRRSTSTRSRAHAQPSAPARTARGVPGGAQRIGRIDALDASPRRLTDPRPRGDTDCPERGTTR